MGTNAQERLDGIAGIANPGVAIVIVFRTPDPLGQGGRRGGRDRTGGRVEQQLERQRIAQDTVALRVGYLQAARPLPPLGIGQIDTLVDLLDILADQRLILAGNDGDPGAVAGADRRLGGDQPILDRLDRDMAAMAKHAEHPIDMEDIMSPRRREIDRKSAV